MIAAVLAAGSAHPAVAGTLLVDDNGPSDPGPGSAAVSDPDEDGSPAHPFDSINEAIGAALDGDEVVVNTGTYTEQIDLRGRAVTVRAAGAVTVRSPRRARTLLCGGGPGSDSIIDGLTLRGPLAGAGGGVDVTSGAPILRGVTIDAVIWDGPGGGLCSVNAAPLLEDCVVSSSTGADGGGVCVLGGAATLVGCTLRLNTSLGQGGGLHAGDGAAVLLDRCRIDENIAIASGGGLAITGDAGVEIVSCRIFDNAAEFNGGGLYAFNGAGAVLVNVTLAGNNAGFGGGGVYAQLGAVVDLVNAIVWSNQPDQLLDTDIAIDVSRSTVQGGWPGVANIALNPLFLDQTGGDLRLQAASPCVDAGDDDAPLVGDALDDVAGKPRRVDAAAGDGLIDMGSAERQVHANDRCADALPITAGGLELNTIAATADEPTGACGGGPDLWYRYDAPCDGTATFELCAAFPTVITAWDACPGSAGALACGSGCDGLDLPVNEDQSYLIQLGGDGPFEGPATLTVTDPPCLPPPTNDACGSASLIFIGKTPFSTLGATSAGPNTPGPCNAAGDELRRDVWFRHFSGCSDQITISICEADFDPKLAVYFQSCPSGAGGVIACSEDSADCGAGPSVTFEANPGDIYRIRLGSADGTTGTGVIDMICLPACPTDVNNNGETEVNDLLAVIVDWGTDGSAFGGDINVDGIVDVEDLIEMILAWGPC